MEHAISGLRDYMRASIDMWQGNITREEIGPEINAYVRAMNELEVYHYGEKKTDYNAIMDFHFPEEQKMTAPQMRSSSENVK